MVSRRRRARGNARVALDELARAVQDWCERHHVFPANGQAAEQISERNIRYYRTLGLLDPPQGNYITTFTEKHRLQLIAEYSNGTKRDVTRLGLFAVNNDQFAQVSDEGLVTAIAAGESPEVSKRAQRRVNG